MERLEGKVGFVAAGSEDVDVQVTLKSHTILPKGIAVLADDLTGAADAAIHFIPDGGNILMLDMTHEVNCQDLSETQWLALTTESRDLVPEEAVRRIRRAVDILSNRPYELIYKKMDSQLRGLPGLEIETLRRSLGLGCSFIAPAYPAQGRVTRDSMHLVQGMPGVLDKADYQPERLVKESSLPRLIAAQAGIKTGHIYLRELDQGMNSLCNRIKMLLADGIRAITFDASTQSHLKLIAWAGLRYFHGTLLAGSAGLALAVSEELGMGVGRMSIAPPRCRSLLFVCGSAADILHRQTGMLVSFVHCREVVIRSRYLTGRKYRDEVEQNALDAWLAGKDLLLKFSVEPFEGPYGSSDMLAQLSSLATRLIEERKPDGVFFSGGETAATVLKSTGVKAVQLKAQAMSGMPWGHAVQGKLDSAVVIMKPGAFGKEDDLVKLYRMWKKEGAENG